MGTVAESLTRLAGHYGLDPTEFDAHLGTTTEKTLGHLPGGSARPGRDFLTIYCAL